MARFVLKHQPVLMKMVLNLMNASVVTKKAIHHHQGTHTHTPLLLTPDACISLLLEIRSL